MPKYALVRSYDPEMTRAQVDGLALSNIAALDTYVYRGGKTIQTQDHGIRWIRSYWQQGGTWGVCLYDAPDLEVLSAYQDLCASPFLEAREVLDLAPQSDSAGGDGARVAVDLVLGNGPDGLLDHLAAMANPETKTGTKTDSTESVRLVRAYWSDRDRRVTALYETTNPEALEQRMAEVAESQPARIVELSPADYR